MNKRIKQYERGQLVYVQKEPLPGMEHFRFGGLAVVSVRSGSGKYQDYELIFIDTGKCIAWYPHKCLTPSDHKQLSLENLAKVKVYSNQISRRLSKIEAIINKR